MSEKEFVTIRIPKVYGDQINKYIEKHRGEMILLGQRPTRAGVVKIALYEFFKKEGIIQSRKSRE